MRRTLLVLVVLLGTMAVPAPASAAVIATCGATLTEDAYLVRDLSCPAGGGLTLADGVTLDLRGHRLVGPGPSAGTGITVAGDASVTVTGGRVQRWATGLALDGGGGSTVTVERVTFAGNGSGVAAVHGIFRVHDSRFADNGAGLWAFRSQVELTRSRLVRNGTGVDGDEDSRSRSPIPSSSATGRRPAPTTPGSSGPPSGTARTACTAGAPSSTA